MKKILVTIISIILLSIIVLAGCAEAENEDSSAKEVTASNEIAGIDGDTVNIGAFSPQSAAAAAVYTQITEGADAYFQQVNASGGINGYDFNYIVRDDAYQPAQTVSVTQRLVESDNIFSLVAAVGTGTNEAVIPYLNENEIPNIGPVCGTEECANSPMYRILFPDYFDEAVLDTQYLVEEMGIEDIAIIYQRDSVGTPARDGLRSYLNTKDLEPLAEIPFDVSETDVTSLVLEARSSGAEGVLFWGTTRHLASVLSEADNIDFNPTWFAASYLLDTSSFELAGDLLNGVHFGTWVLPVESDDPNSVQFREAMEEYYSGEPIGFFHQNGYTQAALFAESFERMTNDGGTPSREELFNEIAKFENEQIGLTEGVDFTNSNLGLSGQSIGHVEDGEFKLLTEFLQYLDVPK